MGPLLVPAVSEAVYLERGNSGDSVQMMPVLVDLNSKRPKPQAKLPDGSLSPFIVTSLPLT